MKERQFFAYRPDDGRSFGVSAPAVNVNGSRQPYPTFSRILRAEPAWKIAMDRVVALITLIILSPILLMVAAMIYIRDPGPIFFGHRRIGRNGKTFLCWKFRTMVTNGDEVLQRHLAESPQAAREWAETRKLKQDPRVSGIGRVLRTTSIDELPQIFNILRGDMSLVGPRPIVDDEVHHYGHAIHDYLSVRPGLTGLWQISGRNDIGYADRVRLDQKYVQNLSFTNDISIILRTVRVVLWRVGSY